jgi:hypothetical protein
METYPSGGDKSERAKNLPARRDWAQEIARQLDWKHSSNATSPNMIRRRSFALEVMPALIATGLVRLEH